MGPESDRRPGVAIRRVFARLAAVALLGAGPLLPCAAQASDTATADAGAEILPPVVFTGPGDMDFGTVTVDATPGTVVLSAAAASTCTTTGGLIHSGDCQAARFEGDVTFLFLLRVQQPPGNQITLTGPGGATMLLNNFTFGPGAGVWDLGQAGAEHRFLIVNFNGLFSFYLGGTLNVAANQSPGRYTGTLQLELNYD